MFMLSSLRVRLLLTMGLVVLVAVGTIAFFSSRWTLGEFRTYVRRDMEHNQRIVSDLLDQYNGDPSPENLQILVDRLAGTSSERIVVADGTGKILADSGLTLVGESLPLPVPFETGVGHVSFDAAPTQFEIGAGLPVTAPFNGAIITSGGEGAVWTVPITGQVGMSWAPLFIPLAMGPITRTGVISDVMARPGVALAGAQKIPGADLIVARLPNPGGTSIQDSFVNSVNQQLLLAAIAAGAAALLLAWLMSSRILRPVEALTAAAGRMERGDLSGRVAVTSKDEIGKLAHAFNAMSDSMARQEELRRNMVTDIAHELRTPLSNIRGYLEAVRDGVIQADTALIGSLHEESLLLSRLVEDLQELQLAEAGHLNIEREAVGVADIIARASTALAPSAEEKNIKIDIDTPADLPPVQADPARIGQVLRNLIDNAITHTPTGGVVRITARAINQEVEIRVEDTGTGIHPEHLPHIFDRFYRADGSRARATGGAGLGLAIVKQLVELHGGRVWAESPPYKGANCYFTLPIANH